MKTFRFEPDKFGASKEERIKGFKGHILLRCPTFEERMQYMEQCGVEFDDTGSLKPVASRLGQLRKMIEVSRPHYQEVALVHTESDEKYSSFDDLASDPACDQIVSVVGGLILKGFRPSKN